MLKHLVRRNPTRNINVKCTEDELAAIKEMADKFTNGNVSEWLRYCGQNHRPPRALLKETKHG